MALVNCNECNREVSDTAPRCPHCGYTSGQYAGKSKSLAIVLALFLGGLGIHKFYLGKNGAGFLYLIFCWTFIPVILGVFDAFVLMGKSERTFTGGVRPGIASGLATNSAGDVKVFYKQPVFWVVLAAIAILVFAFNNSRSNESSPATTSTQSPTPSRSSEKATTEDSSSQCFKIETNIIMIRNLFDDGAASPRQAQAVLDSAASDWGSIATSFTGSKSEWLKKMAELSTDLGSYIATGEPADGELLLDQLYNNFALADNFCG